MITIECNLPDINFYIKVDERDYDIVAKKVNESIIPYDKNTSKYIEIDYIVDENKFISILNLIENNNGIIYDSFKKQKHKEVKFQVIY